MSEQKLCARYDLEFIPIRDGDEEMILVRDHLGLAPEGLALPPGILRLLSLLDGTRTKDDLQVEIIRLQDGQMVDMSEVDYLVRQLDEAFLLESETFQTAKEALEAEFAAASVRPAALAGQAYPESKEDLEDFLNDILTTQPPFEADGRVAALAAPHIDPGLGEKVYARAYRALLREKPSRVIILGVGHQIDQGLFSLTSKDFQTPLGLLRTDKEAAARLALAGKDVAAPTDFHHRLEHSIEFQTIFLQHVLRERPFAILPVLCGSLMALPEYSREAYLGIAGDFLDALGDIVMDPEHETLVVAGVDLSHIGPKFGHQEESAQLERGASAHDRALLTHLTRQSPGQFWEESAREGDHFNVCGFSALACLLEILPPCRGLVLDYALWREEPTRSAVSFAATVFTSEA